MPLHCLKDKSDTFSLLCLPLPIDGHFINLNTNSESQKRVQKYHLHEDGHTTGMSAKFGVQKYQLDEGGHAGVKEDADIFGKAGDVENGAEDRILSWKRWGTGTNRAFRRSSLSFIDFCGCLRATNHHTFDKFTCLYNQNIFGTTI